VDVEGTGRLPCRQCGAYLEFDPGTGGLRCAYCGHRERIESDRGTEIEEHSFREALARAPQRDARHMAEAGVEIACDACGAVAVIEGHASRCAFCDSPVTVRHQADHMILPESLLPFAVTRSTAGRSFRRWLSKLWFAPSDLARVARSRGLDGAYLPYWTYDAQTTSRYRGLRGDYYYVTESYTDQRGKRKTRRVRKTRWTPAAGTVWLTFDDVLVSGSSKVPRWILRRLEPWDLHALTGFEPSYLKGFEALRYDVDLEAGFERAKERMDPDVRAAVNRDIGGDTQQIHDLRVAYGEVTFKHLLLPVWISSFRYRDRVFRFVVNARTGEVAGERPWSALKIAAAVILGLIVLLGILYLRQSGL
jgi:hypothetical protein